MGHRGKNTTFEQQQLVVFHHSKGKSCQQIASMLKMKKTTVWNIIRRFRDEDRLDLRQQSRRPKVLTAREENYVIRKVKRNPRLSAPKIAAQLELEIGKKVHPETIRRVLRGANFHGRVARNKPFLKNIHKRKRLLFAKEHLEKDKTWWNRVIFSDESKFNIYSSDGRIIVWRKPNTELEERNLQATMKHGGGSVML